MKNVETVLLLRPKDLIDVITVGEAIDIVEQGYREASSFPLINAPRRRVHSRKNVRVSNFPGGVDGLRVIGSLTRAECVSYDQDRQIYPYREHPVYLLWDSETAQLQGILIGEITDKRIGYSSLMALRTAATSGPAFGISCARMRVLPAYTAPADRHCTKCSPCKMSARSGDTRFSAGMRKTESLSAGAWGSWSMRSSCPLQTPATFRVPPTS